MRFSLGAGIQQITGLAAERTQQLDDTVDRRLLSLLMMQKCRPYGPHMFWRRATAAADYLCANTAQSSIICSFRMEWISPST